VQSVTASITSLIILIRANSAHTHLLDHSEQGKLSTHCLATASRSRHQHAVIQVVQHIEGLSLNGIEAPEALVQTLKLCIPAYQHQAAEFRMRKKKRKEKTTPFGVNEKPSIIPGCPGVQDEQHCKDAGLCMGSTPDESCRCGDKRLASLAMKTLMRPILLDGWLSWCLCFLLV